MELGFSNVQGFGFECVDTGKHMLTRIYVSIKCAEGVPSCTLNDLSDRRVWGLMCSDPCPFRPAHIRTQIIFNGAWGSIVL